MEEINKEIKKELRKALGEIPAGLLPIAIQVLDEAFNEVLEEYRLKAAVIARDQGDRLFADFLKCVIDIKNNETEGMN